MQPCKLCFGEPGIGGQAGTAAGGEKTRQKERSKVKKAPVGEEKKCGGGISYHHHGFDDVQRCPVCSVSVQAWSPRRGRSPAARWRGGEQERERAPRSMCCPFIGAFAHAQSMSLYVQFVPCVLPS